MSNSIHITERDLALLRLLDMTPATAAHVLAASATFPDGAYRDERRVRERLQAISAAELVRVFPMAVQGGGLSQYYRLTRTGYRLLYPDFRSQPPRSAIAEIAPTRCIHAMAVADVIVQVLIAAHAARIQIGQFHGDGRLVLTIGQYSQYPDCHFQFEANGKVFNVLFEIDNNTEPLESNRVQSLKAKLLGYEAYQDCVLKAWKDSGCIGIEPRFRVVVITRSQTRARHILWLARQCARNPVRRLCLAGTQSEFLNAANPLTTPMLNDHHGEWQPIVNIHPTAKVVREPIRLEAPLATRVLV